MKIQETSNEEIPTKSSVPCSKPDSTISVKKSQPNTSQVKDNGKKVQQEDDDFAKLIIPKKIVPSRFAKIAAAMGGNVSKANKNQANQKAASNEKAQRTVSARKPTIMPPKIIMSKKNVTTYDNGVVIEEL